MKGLLLGFLILVSFSALAQDEIIVKLQNAGILCNQEGFISNEIYAKLKKDPTNAKLKSELMKASAALAKCNALAFDEVSNDCDDSVFKLLDKGFVCSREITVSDKATALYRVAPSAANKEKVLSAQRDVSVCTSKALVLCN